MRVVAFDLAMFIWVIVFSTVYSVLNAPKCASTVLFGGVVLAIILLALRRGMPPWLAGTLFCGTAWGVYTVLALFTGGVASPAAMWFASVPVLAMFLCGPRSGIFWTLASVATATLMAIAREYGFQWENELTPASLRFIQFSGLVGLVLCVHLLMSVLRKLEHHARQVLREANRRLAFQASTDGLTGIANRRSFDHALEEEWLSHQRAELPLSLVLIDADYFKEYNDAYGHLAGDDCLRMMARVVQAGINRGGDLVARYGGEEFAVILPNTSEAGASAVAKKIQESVKALEIPHPRSPVSRFITISIGTATAVPTREASLLDFVHDADVALYQAKESGRDRTVQLAPLAPAFG